MAVKSVCAACGQPTGAMPYYGYMILTHAEGCPREEWPIGDAIEYDDGTIATTDNWIDRSA